VGSAGSAPGRLHLVDFQTIPEVGDRQLVTGTELALLGRSAVDPGAVGAPQVADSDLTAVPVQAAVEPRHAERVEPGVAAWVAAHQEHGAIERDVPHSVQ
jgi:hypothetical protein